MKSRKVLFIPFFIAGVLFLLSGAVMLLWNEILSPVLEISTITFWQAMGIFVLSKLLFGFRTFGKSPSKGRFGHRGRWNRMSHEEKQHYKEAWKRRCETRKVQNEKNPEDLK